MQEKGTVAVSADERRSRIVKELSASQAPVSGGALADSLKVSRQVIVQDIALLRANGHAITATNRGYVMERAKGLGGCERRFKVHHAPEQTEDELTCIVDLGGTVEDVMVNHRVYGRVTAPLGIKSRRDIARFSEDMRTGRSSLLMTVTSGYHFHLVSAQSEEVLDEIEQALLEKGYLADYLPHERE